MDELREIDAEELTVRSQEVIAFEDFATEAIRRMEPEDFPVWVVNDRRGRDLYAETVKPWRKSELLPPTLRCPTDQWAVENGGG